MVFKEIKKLLVDDLDRSGIFVSVSPKPRQLKRVTDFPSASVETVTLMMEHNPEGVRKSTWVGNIVVYVEASQAGSDESNLEDAIVEIGESVVARLEDFSFLDGAQGIEEITIKGVLPDPFSDGAKGQGYIPITITYY